MSGFGKPSYRRVHMDGVAHYRGTFEVPTFCDAPCADPLYCCFCACACHQCASYQLRKRALHDNMGNYQCCGGYHPCAQRNCLNEQACPEVCLAAEVMCCFPSSVMSTRLMLQHEMQIGNSECDNNLMCCISACECFACLVSAFGDEQNAELVHTLADAIYYSTCACMQTQHKVQLDARDRGQVVTFQTTTVTTIAPIVPQGMYATPMQQPVMYAPQPQMGYAQPQQMGYPQQQQQYGGQPQYAAQPGYAPQQQYGQPQYAAPSQGQMMMGGQGRQMGPPGGKGGRGPMSY